MLALSHTLTKVSLIVFIMSAPCLLLAQGTYTAVYSDGDIPTSRFYEPTCNGPTTTLSITLPSDQGDIKINAVDIEYVGEGPSNNWLSTNIYCQTTGVDESEYGYSGGGFRSREGLSIANGVYAPGTVLTFEMQAWVSYLGIPNTCTTDYAYIANDTWRITAYSTSNTATYTEGDIPTSLSAYDPTCNGPTTTLDVTMPYGYGDFEVYGVNISYNMTAADDGWMSDQRSQVRCQNTNITESVATAIGNSNGTYSYERNSVDIANGTYPAGTTLTFEMRTWRTYGGSGCNTTFNKVDDGTWTITVEACPTGEITLHNQFEVEDFTTSFNCTSLEILNIGDDETNDIDDISGLDEITEVSDFLQVRYTDLVDLHGLENLSEVHTLSIHHNDALTGLTNLGSMDTIQNLGIYDNDMLSDLSGLEDLVYVPQGLSISYNDNLVSLDGINNLTRAGTIIINSNPSLPSLSGLDNLSLVRQPDILGGTDSYPYYGLEIRNNEALTDISSLTTLHKIYGNLSIIGNNALMSLVGLHNIDTVGWNIEVSGLSIASLLPLSSLKHIGNDLSIRNTTVQNLRGLEGIKQLYGDFEIRSNENLDSLSGMSMHSIFGDLGIINNDNLIDVSGLLSLRNLLGDFGLSENPLLSECCIIKSLYPNVLSGAISISDNSIGCNSFTDIDTTCNNLDPDQDFIFNWNDNCPDHYNPNQEDNDNDGIGNACDNCPLIANVDQADTNDNFIGDSCENAEPGRAGINTADPKSGLEISASELYLSDTQRGLIMTNAVGDCFRIYIDMEGNMQNIKITCPE